MNDDTLLEEMLIPRTVRPTGQLKQCAVCGDQIISGYRCLDCLQEFQRAALKRDGKPFSSRRHPHRKFSTDQIREIRGDGRTDHHFVKEMSQKYNVGPATIYSILLRETYKEVE